ncbi:hypothetical protein O181_023512 [Austropuccinia psidii MF-1]|uniref:Uncharacterized protein n=1 Tax=Austropuccinia psidii MF-1 TaxID=1389203 RepID=A0A9Q3CJN6_9BASI|nr:hypothetical protein [Austropuccinia psidii MF-1]
MSTLLSTVSEELQPVLLQKEYFLESLKALSEACGQNCMVTLCQRLFDLVNLTYDPNTSLANHAYKFTDLFRSFQNCAVGNTFQMDIGEGAAATILLMSHPRPHLSGVTPTCFNQGANLEEKFKVFLDKYMKEYFANYHSSNQAEEKIHDNKTTEELTEDDDGFYVQEDAHDQLQLMSISSENNTELIHDSGAS